jgi:hypothetical protein
MQDSLPYPLCNTQDALLANSLAYVQPDKFPVTTGHVLIIPVRRESDFLGLGFDEPPRGCAGPRAVAYEA